MYEWYLNSTEGFLEFKETISKLISMLKFHISALTLDYGFDTKFSW